MKDRIIQSIKWAQENQNGLFKIAVLFILIYWTILFQNIADNYVDVSGVELELSDISRKLVDIDTSLASH